MGTLGLTCESRFVFLQIPLPAYVQYFSWLTFFFFTTTSIIVHWSFALRLIIMSKTFSASDVAAHKKPDDLWVIVDEDVYDLTQFQAEHPGEYSVCQFV